MRSAGEAVQKKGTQGGNLEKWKNASETFEGLRNWDLTHRSRVPQKTVDNIQPSVYLPHTVLTVY